MGRMVCTRLSSGSAHFSHSCSKLIVSPCTQPRDILTSSGVGPLFPLTDVARRPYLHCSRVHDRIAAAQDMTDHQSGGISQESVPHKTAEALLDARSRGCVDEYIIDTPLWDIFICNLCTTSFITFISTKIYVCTITCIMVQTRLCVPYTDLFSDLNHPIKSQLKM